MDARQPTQISVSAVVTRADGRVENLGVIAFSHRNPLRVLAWRIGRLLRGRKAGHIISKDTKA